MPREEANLIIEKFDRKAHDRNGFTCGKQALDAYLQHQISQDVRKDLCTAYILREERSNLVLGYYTLSSLSVLLTDLPEEAAKRLRYNSIPSVLLGRLAVEKGLRGKGYGKLLIADAYKRVKKVSEEIGVYAIVVDALDDEAVGFYQAFGFELFLGSTDRLFIPLRGIS